MSTNKGTYNHAKLDEAIADNMLEEELDKKPAAVSRDKEEKKKRTHQRSTDTSTSAKSRRTLASDPITAASSPPPSSRHHGHHSKHHHHGHTRRHRHHHSHSKPHDHHSHSKRGHDHHSHSRRPREPEVAGARTKGTEDNKYNIATPSNSESHANTPCSASKPPVVAPVRPTADPSPVIVPALNPRGPPSRHPRMPDSDDYAITAQPNTARNTNSPWASSWNPTEVARQTTKRRSATTNYDDTTVAPTRPTQQAAASLTTMADADVEDRKRPASKKEYTQPSADSSAMSVVVPNPRPAPVGLPSRGPAASYDNGLNEYEAHTSTDIETGEVLDTNEQLWSLPRPPREERRPGAFHPDGRNAREVSVVDENTVITSSEPDVPVSPAPVEEVCATLVDQDEEERKRREQNEKEIKEALERQAAEIERNTEVADVVTGFWCSPRIKRFIALGVVLAIIAIVLGIVLSRVLAPPTPTPPPTAAPTSPLSGLIELLSSVSFDGGAALETPGTPQNKALNWLANNNTYLASYSDDKMIQRYVLVTLYYSTNGDSWDNNNDWLSDTDECGWHNRADDVCSNGAIVELNLDSNKLNGTIPAELALLSSSVDEVHFGSNVLTGTIPSEIAMMTELNELYLWGNELTGTIPSEIALMTELVSLSLFNNALTGTIPSEIAQMTNLNWLSLSNNTLTGTIPSEIAQMTELGYLWLSENKLTGTIPSEIAQMTELDYLYLDSNELTGTIPSEIALMTNLNWLWLYDNAFSGNFTCPDFIRRCYISCDDEYYQELNSTCRTL